MNLGKTEGKIIPVVKSGHKVQIGLPKLCNYDDDDEEEEEPKPTLKNLKPTEETAKKPTDIPRSGLLNILPPPKSATNPFIKKPAETPVFDSAPKLEEKEKTTSLLLPRHMMGKMPVKIADQDSEFRPVVKKSQPTPIPIPDEDPEPFEDDEKDEDHNHDDNHHHYHYEEDPELEETDETSSPTTSAPVKPINTQAMDKEALLRLCGPAGKKRKLDDFQLTDVSASQIVGDNKAELLKQVTSEYKPPSNKDYFSSSSRRTHHVTYLAKVAVERDQELKATWAQSKLNRKLARQKYGF